MSNYSLLFKFIMVGNSAVGKSCLVLQFEEGKINEEHDTTIGVEFGSKSCQINGEQVRIQIWDTAGQENFRSIIRSYYRSAIGAMVVYDITRRQSFQDLQKWIEEIRENGNPNVVILACGNKCDLEAERQVSTEEGRGFAESLGLLFMETSAKDGTCVEEAFLTVAKEVYKKVNDGRITLGKHEPGVKVGTLYKYQTEEVSPFETQKLQQQNQTGEPTQKKDCC